MAKSKKETEVKEEVVEEEKSSPAPKASPSPAPAQKIGAGGRKIVGAKLF